MPKASMFGVWIRWIGNGITSDTFTPAVSELGTSKVVQLLISGIDCVLFNDNYTDQDSLNSMDEYAVKRTLGWETILDDGSADPGKSVDLN
jgi:hypothetical protein